MAIDVQEPPMAEGVESSVKTEVVENKPTRGRRAAKDDTRVEYVRPDSMVDEKGLITVWPDENEYVWGTEDSCHKPLNKKAFSKPEIYTDYRIAGKLNDVKLIYAEIDVMKKNRDAFGHIENAGTREKAKKARKLYSTIKALMVQLKKDGVSPEDLEALGGTED